MRLTVLLAALMAAASVAVNADPYQTELGGAVSRLDQDGLNSKGDQYMLDGKVYFKTVSTAERPLAEAAYLGQHSNLFAGVARNERKPYGADSTDYNAGLEVYIPEKFLYVRVDGKHYRYDQRSDTEVVTTLGLTPLDGLRVTTEWNSDNSYTANLSAKYVAAIGNDQFINLETTLVNKGETSVGGDFYVDSTFSVGLAYMDLDAAGEAYEVRTRKFFGEQWSGELAYLNTDAGDKVTAGLTLRF